MNTALPKTVGFNVFGYLSADIGVGQAARNLIEDLDRHGFPLRGIDVHTGDRRSGRIAGYEATRGDWSNVETVVDWVCCNAPELEPAWRPQFPETANHNRLLVNMSFWELPHFTQKWCDALNGADVLIAPTRFIETAMNNAGLAPPVIHLPQTHHPGALVDGDRRKFGLPESGMLFLSAFDVNSDPSRKNPMAAIEAFERAFPSTEPEVDAHLVVKVAHWQIRPEGKKLLANLEQRAANNARIHLLWDAIPASELMQFYASCDAFISLHRSEGLGLVLMEMMGLAKPVIATAFSGNLDFCSAENSCLVDFAPTPVIATEPLYSETMAAHPACHWAEPDIEAAAAWIRRLTLEPETAQAIGRRGRNDILALMQSDRTEIFERIADIARRHTPPTNPAAGRRDSLAPSREEQAPFQGEAAEEPRDLGYRWAKFKRETLGVDLRLVRGKTTPTQQPLPPHPETHWSHALRTIGLDPGPFDNTALEGLGLEPGIRGDHLAVPTDLAFPPNPVPDLRGLPTRQKDNTLLVVINHLQSQVFYAGYSIFFEALRTIAGNFDRIVVAVNAEPFEPELLAHFHRQLEVCRLPDLAQHISASPRLTACNSALLHLDVREHLPKNAPVLHYCLESDEVFHLPGPLQLRCQRSIHRSDFLVVHSGLLAKYLFGAGLIRPGTQVNIASGSVSYLTGVQAGQTDKSIFCYFRPEQHNLRNFAAEIWAAAHTFANRHKNEGWTLYLVGTVGTSLSKSVAGNHIVIAPKLPVEQYHQIISRTRAVVALIQAPHPGVIAFQAAASGIPTVTNVYVNRPPELLTAISSNLIPWTPLTEDLADRMETAIEARQGVPDFAPALYAGLDLAQKEDVTIGHFDAFVDQILTTT